MQSRCFRWCNIVNQPPVKEGDTKNLMFAENDAQGPKATESNRKNISPQVAQTVEEMHGGWGGGKRDTACPGQLSSPVHCMRELGRKKKFGARPEHHCIKWFHCANTLHGTAGHICYILIPWSRKNKSAACCLLRKPLCRLLTLYLGFALSICLGFQQHKEGQSKIRQRSWKLKGRCVRGSN